MNYALPQYILKKKKKKKRNILCDNTEIQTEEMQL